MKSAFRSIFIGVLVIALWPFSIACAKTFWGKVIDADTKEPVEGAVVVAEWTEELTTATATHTRLKDVKEVLTDKKGEWMIKGPPGGEIGDTKAKISFLTGVYFMKPVQFYIFKPGYCPSPAVPGITICVERTRLQGEEGDGGILELPKLTSQEDRRKAVWKRPDAWFEMTENKQKAKRVKNFLRLLSEEEKRLGLDEEPMWKEIENEK